MEAEKIKRVCVESCKEVYSYIEDMQYVDETIGRSTIRVTNFQIRGEYVILHIARRIQETGELGLSIGNKSFFEPDVYFDQFDEVSLTLVLYPSEEVMGLLNSSRLENRGQEVSLITDLKWLIERTRRYYDKFGHMIGYPRFKPDFRPDDCIFPKGLEPSEEQTLAVEKILTSELTYIWGAPGTGKTQFVLATAMMACLRKGKRVAILAPTNNSLEQVLRGLLKIIEREDPEGKMVDLKKDILRLGTATLEFTKEYPDVCEKAGIFKKIKLKEESLRALEDVIFERRCDLLKAHFDEISVLMGEEYQGAGYFAKKKMMSQIRKYIHEIKEVLSTSRDFEKLAEDFDEYNVKIKAEAIAKVLYERPRPALAIDDYIHMTDEELKEHLSVLEAEIEELRAMSPEARIGGAKILAMTPQVFMGRLSPVPGSDKPALDADHIFIDEVGYCNVINILPLFACGVPITMLGDHMQLPPVCEIDEKVIIDGIENDTCMRYSYMWDQSAIFAESYLFKDVKDIQKAYLESSGPEFSRTVKADLTISHRFGDNFAAILNECIYRNGISGVAEHPLDIDCIDAVCESKNGRENVAEARAIGEFLVENPMESDEFVILTPYKDQVFLLNREYPELKDNILTVHKSQGREWDTVILSVADNRVSNKEVPLRFTSTVDESSAGRKVVNTAVSRAKRRLVVVCDKEFWSDKDGELIGRLASYDR